MKRLRAFLYTDNPITISTVVLLGLALIIVPMSLPFVKTDFARFFFQILIESYGMLFDLAVIGILIFWLNKSRETKLLIRTYQDEIDDFRLWKSEEAAYRTVGNIKRLNRHKIYNINLVKTYLVETNLSYIKLIGSNLNLADMRRANLIQSDLSETRLNQAILEEANLNQANLENSFAGGANFKGAFLIKTNLKSAFLINSDFSGSYLMEADLRGAHLSEAVFIDASLYKADIRGVQGLTLEQIGQIKTLQNAKMDDDVYHLVKTNFPTLLGEELTVS